VRGGKERLVPLTMAWLEARYVPEPMSGCWLWTSTIEHDGYGVAKIDGVMFKAHRAAYHLLVGPVPDGLTIDHLCCTTCCVNPAHMEPVTAAENARRARLRMDGKTHCAHGHELTGANLYRGRRGNCLACRKASTARSNEKVAERRAAARAARGQFPYGSLICPRGHSKTGDNAYHWGGNVYCSTCRLAATRRANRRAPPRRATDGATSERKARGQQTDP
jgi:hypothetical protein